MAKIWFPRMGLKRQLLSTAITTTTDNSGGAVSDTIAAIAAGAGYTQADMVAVKNAIASLTAKQNTLIADLKAMGGTQ